MTIKMKQGYREADIRSPQDLTTDRCVVKRAVASATTYSRAIFFDFFRHFDCPLAPLSQLGFDPAAYPLSIASEWLHHALHALLAIEAV